VISSSELPPGGLIGRAAETAAIRRAIGQSRLVTVTGLPGVGKTGAAMAAAASAGGRPLERMLPDGPLPDGLLPDGMVLIRLDALQDEVLLPHTITAAMGLPDSFGVSPLEALITELSGMRLLIMLDTCEHLLGACAAVAAAIGHACPGVRILATSREPLRVPGEETLDIAPLSARDSIELFRRRAGAATPGSDVLDPDVLAAVCERLDGLPLAIGMAARQLSIAGRIGYSLDALLAGLQEGYDFLSDPGALVPRHRTLPAAIGWSHQLCTPAERLLWARLAVFDSPFSIKDCQEVCATTHLTDESIAVGVQMLAERSLLLRVAGDPPRFLMPATIRWYGMAMLRRLAEEEEMHRRYWRWRSGPRRDACWH
jgi:non-specific serine/threonine protein kinase